MHTWTDEQQRHEILTRRQSDDSLFKTNVIDAETGHKIGGLGIAADTVVEIVKDVSPMTDINDQPIGKVDQAILARACDKRLTGKEKP